VIWGRVSAIRGNFTIERLQQVFAEFEDKGLLFVWEREGNRYAHWTGSDVPGRLPPPSWRMRMEKFAPPVPRQQLVEYMARFTRGRAAMGSGGFRGDAGQGAEKLEGNFMFENSDLKDGAGRLADSDLKGRGEIAGVTGGINGWVEEGQGQDLNLDWELVGNGKKERDWGAAARAAAVGGNAGLVSNSNDYLSSSSNSNAHPDLSSRANSNAQADSSSSANSDANSTATALSRENLNSGAQVNSKGLQKVYGWNAKEELLARELRVGWGPVAGPIRVRPEILERERLRQAALAKRRSP
jgi:hypothetical protein